MKRLWLSHPKRPVMALISVIIFVGLGTIVLMARHAATPLVPPQPDSTHTTTITPKVTHTTTSGGGVTTPSSNATSTPAPTAKPTSPSSSTSTPTPTPSPTSPTTTSGCPPAPAFPDANCTGWQHTGVTLTAYTGPYTIDVDGTVIDGKDVTGCLYITASNVTIKNSRITCAGSSPTSGVMIIKYGDYYNGAATGLSLTDDEITRPAGNGNGADLGVQDYAHNLSMTRVYIHNVTTGIGFAGGSNGGANGALLEDSYIGDLVNISGSDHNDGVMSNGGATGITLRHNNLEVPLGQTTPIAIYADLNGPNTYWTIDHNLINGGGYGMYPSYDKASEQPNNHIVVTNNVFGRKFFSECGQWGPVDYGVNGATFYDGTGNTWTGNTWGGGAMATSTHNIGDAVNP